MSKANSKNITNLLKPGTQQKILAFADKEGVSLDALLNALIDDEIERHRLLKISDEIDKEGSKETAPSQKITKICKKHLLGLNHENESFAIRKAIERLHADLLRQKIISVNGNAREGRVVESQRFETSRVAYYWYAGVLAKRTALCGLGRWTSICGMNCYIHLVKFCL